MPKASSTGFSRSCELVCRQAAATSNTRRERYAIARHCDKALGQHNGLQLRHRPVQNVVDQNIAVLAIILNLLAGLAQPAVDTSSSFTTPSARLRLRSRVRKTLGLGGRTKMLTASGILARTCAAPCTSMSSSRS